MLNEIDIETFLEKLKTTDTELFSIIKDLKLKKAHRLFEAVYPYGAYISKAGTFYLPTTEFTESKVDQDIFSELSYNNIPLGIVMQKGYEVFREFESHIIPRSVRHTGLEMGIWEMVSPTPGFSVTAGSRSVFFLPKIADAAHHKRLKKYGVKRHVPHDYFEQWEIFTEIAADPSFSEPWSCNIVYLGKQWINDLNNPKWLKLKVYLLEKALQHSTPNRTQITLDAIWENFRNNLSARYYKVNPYILETLKHLVMIANGGLPGFKVADESTDIFPYQGIKKIYVEEYGLDNYTPTMFFADFFNIEKDQSIYYSLQIPTSPNVIKPDKNLGTIRNNLFDLIELQDLFLQDISADRLGGFGKNYYDLFGRLEFEFFHSDPEEDKGVYASKDMPKSDPKLLVSPNLDFPHHSSFVRGCVRIGKK